MTSNQKQEYPQIEVKNTLRRLDSFDIESSNVKGHDGTKEMSWAVVLSLAFQSLGVIYGDIGTSPLYVYASTFPNGIKDKNDIIGVLSLIYYTITLLPLIKYVFIVLNANDNGKGGTFAMYSLLCRNAKVGLLPNTQIKNQQVSNYELQLPSNNLRLSLKFKNFLESSMVAKYILLIVTMLSTSLVIGDGVLTPSISVLSAVSGLKEASSSTFTEGRVVWISVAILILLFSVQRFGTDKVGYSFAPIVSVWLVMNAGMGLYNFIKYDPTVIKAVNPWHIVQYFRRNGKDAWISLGGVVLCIAGTEALFADVGHFSVRSIQISMSTVVYPAIILTYSGQASYLRLHQEDVTNAFYKAIPGIAVVLAETITSSFMILVLLLIWKKNVALVVVYICCIMSVELLYLTAVLYKFPHGGYFPLAVACLSLSIMCIWNYVYRKKYYYEEENKVSPESVRALTSESNLCRIPGMVIFYSELVNGIPPIFVHYVGKVPALQSVVVFASIKSLPVSSVPVEEWFFFRRVQPRELYVFRCVARYGYIDPRNEDVPFERLLVERLKEFMRADFEVQVRHNQIEHCPDDVEVVEDLESDYDYIQSNHSEEEMTRIREEDLEKEIEVIEKSSRVGIVHVMGETEVISSKEAGYGKKFVIDLAYNFIKRNLRAADTHLEIPRERLLKVGMTYEL